MRQALREEPGGPLPARLRKGPEDGITLAAFRIENYRHEPLPGSKQYQDEVQLDGLFALFTIQPSERTLRVDEIKLAPADPEYRDSLQGSGAGCR